MKIRIEYSDGLNWAEVYTEEHALAGMAFVEVDRQWWARYRKHCAQARIWQHKLSLLDNIQGGKDHPTDPLYRSFAKAAQEELSELEGDQ